MKLKFRLSLLFLVVVAIGAATTLVLVRRSTETMFRSFVFAGDSEKARAYADILSAFRLERGSWEGVQAFLDEMPALLSKEIATRIRGESGWGSSGFAPSTLRSLMADRVVLADSDGMIVADTAKALVGTVHPSAHLDHGIPIMASFQRTGTVLVGSMIDSSLTGGDVRFLDSVMRSLVWSTAASTAIALLVGILFAARITRPLGALSVAARRVASGDLSSPVPVVGRDELAELSASFNEMTTELKRLDAAKKQVIADSAHELRTPVTLIQGIVEGMIDGVFPLDEKGLESVHEETLRLSRLIDTLRELEIIESGELELTIEGVDLDEAIGKALVLFAPAAKAKTIELGQGSAGPGRAVASGDYFRLGEVVYNLVSNAIKYTPEGGRVLLARGEGPAGFVEFRVEDSGPGIGPDERERIFERFYRIDRSRSSGTGGRGLGLAIASEIVKAHGGSIAIEDSDLGGASFVVRLPRFVS